MKLTPPSFKIPPIIKDWLQETINRLFIKKPKYFIYWQWISGLATMICGIPFLLKNLNIELPDPFDTFSNKLVTWVGFAIFVMGQLTVSAPPVAQTPEGGAVKTIDDKKMPLTAKSEAKKVEEMIPPPPEVDVEKPNS
jgi:hypothetical protein